MNPISTISFQAGTANQLLLNPRLSSEEKAELHQLQRHFEQFYPKNDFVFIASSGSSQKTNESLKLVALPLASVLNSARRFNQFFNAGPADKWGLVLPTFHVAGLSILARAYLAGSEVGHQDWQPEKIGTWFQEQKISFLSLVPTQVFDLVQFKIPAPSGLKKVFVGAGSLHDDLRSSFLNLGWPVVETYGMTETCSMVAVRSDEKLFQVLPGVEVRLNQDLLQIKCDALAHSFTQKKGDQIVTQILAPESWLQTEDRALIDHQANSSQPAFLDFRGRSGDYVKVLGEGVSLLELRDRLEKLVLQSGLPLHRFFLLALSDPRRDHQLVLIGDRETTAEEAERLVARFNEKVRPYEKIQRCVFVTIPRTSLGKVRLEELKKNVTEEIERSKS